MKPYTVEIEIDLSRDKVLELFDNVENLYKWQAGLLSFEHLSGETGQVAAQSKMSFLSNGNRIELTETITKRNLPDEFDGTYEWDGGKNTLQNRFIAIAPEKTKWESTCGYEFKTLFMKLMGFFCAGKFREQNVIFMQNFKKFCASGYDVRDD
ncbi:MAG: hypothetical protein ACI9G1_005640 [Pirellulaceae bacterium]|jgi:hypothetical protein